MSTKIQKSNLYALKLFLYYLAQDALLVDSGTSAANATVGPVSQSNGQCSAILTLSGTREHGRMPVRFLTGPLLYYTRVAVLRHGNEWEFGV